LFEQRWGLDRTPSMDVDTSVSDAKDDESPSSLDPAQCNQFLQNMNEIIVDFIRCDKIAELPLSPMTKFQTGLLCVRQGCDRA
jgi:hypothetical protein